MRIQVAIEYSLIQEYSPYLSLWLSTFFLKLPVTVELNFCKDQGFSLAIVQTKTSTNLHKNACDQ